MKIKVLYDKNTGDAKLLTGWGVSFLADGRILFDTGEKGDSLLLNMRALEVDINKIEAVVLSHDHWDHTGGLWDLLQIRKGLPVYACPGFSREFKDKVIDARAELIEAGEFSEISDGIYITGEIPGTYKGKYMGEQALVLKTNNGLTVVTGCAHPGILKMLEMVKGHFPDEPLYMVMGGFHLKDSDERSVESVIDEFRKTGVLKAGPTHCSGDDAEAMFQESYKNDFQRVLVGQELNT